MALRTRSRTRIARRRAGFSLIEVIVTLAILAGLLAVLFPVVVDQVERGEPTRIASDLGAISSALEVFRIHVLEVPDDLEDLVNPLTIADRRLDGETYTERQTERWEGPYLDTPFLEAGAGDPLSPDSLDTGYKSWIMPQLALYNSLTSDSLPRSAQDQANYVAVMVRGMTRENFEVLNRAIDGTSEESGSDGECPVCSWDRGKLRWDDATETAYYLALPYKPR